MIPSNYIAQIKKFKHVNLEQGKIIQYLLEEDITKIKTEKILCLNL